MHADTALRAAASSRYLSAPLLSLLLLAVMAVSPGSNAHAEPATWKTEGWHKTDFRKTRIGWNEIFSGGPPKDGIRRSTSRLSRLLARVAILPPLIESPRHDYSHHLPHSKLG